MVVSAPKHTHTHNLPALLQVVLTLEEILGEGGRKPKDFDIYNKEVRRTVWFCLVRSNGVTTRTPDLALTAHRSTNSDICRTRTSKSCSR